MRDSTVQIVRLRRMIAILTAVITLQTGIAQSATATPYQLRDVVEFGANEFHIAQLPLQEIVERSKVPLAITSTANNKGYEAKWAIQGNQLFLIEFKAQNKEREVRIGEIIDNAKLPLRANWFSGKLQFPIGEFDYGSQWWPIIIEVTFDKGKLKHISSAKNAVEIFTWNGSRREKLRGEQKDAHVPPKSRSVKLSKTRELPRSKTNRASNRTRRPLQRRRANRRHRRGAYQPYGASEELNPDFTTYSGTDYNWEYRFTGRRLDLDTGLQLNRNRYYHNQLGRWISRDPIGYEGGDLNLYGYVGGRPSTRLDPLGLRWPTEEEDRRAHGGVCHSPRTVAKCGRGQYEREYDTTKQCCFYGKVVSKVPIWICKRSLGSTPWLIGVFDFCQLDHLPGIDFDVAHSYVCCSGANIDCYGKQSTCKIGHDIPPEMLCTGKCKKKMVCPIEKYKKCNNPYTRKDYSVLKRAACHDWANR